MTRLRLDKEDTTAALEGQRGKPSNFLPMLLLSQNIAVSPQHFDCSLWGENDEKPGQDKSQDKGQDKSGQVTTTWA